MSTPSRPTGAPDARSRLSERGIDPADVVDALRQPTTLPWPERFRLLHPKRSPEAPTAVELVGELRDEEQPSRKPLK
jgi:hypothetical protein